MVQVLSRPQVNGLLKPRWEVPPMCRTHGGPLISLILESCEDSVGSCSCLPQSVPQLGQMAPEARAAATVAPPPPGTKNLQLLYQVRVWMVGREGGVCSSSRNEDSLVPLPCVDVASMHVKGSFVGTPQATLCGAPGSTQTWTVRHARHMPVRGYPTPSTGTSPKLSAECCAGPQPPATLSVTPWVRSHVTFS